MSIETPNGAEFSIAAKLYLCSGKLLPPSGGMYFGYPSPSADKVDNRTLAKLIGTATVDWLEANNYITLAPGSFKQLLGSTPTLLVTAVYSGAPGFSGEFLEATHWAQTDLVTIFSRLLPRAQAPFIDLLDGISLEFARAGVLTRGGYGAHGNSWDQAWLAYLLEAWYPEAYDAWQRVQARADKAVIERSLMTAVAGAQHTERDDD